MYVAQLEQTPGATLLIVDDDRSAREGLRSIFEGAGHRTITAEDAPSALKLLRQQACDLVMVDVELPDVDGVALCRLLRAQPSLRQLPLVIFSANDSEGRKVDAFTAGADDYIVKPSSPGELLSRVNSHLNFAQRESDLIGTNRELGFLADLGRGLLQTLYPEQVSRRVAGAIYEGTNAEQTACAIKNNGKGLAVCVFDREGSAGNQSLVDLPRLDRWIDALDSVVALKLTKKREFFLRDAQHAIEYVVPIRFNRRLHG